MCMYVGNTTLPGRGEREGERWEMLPCVTKEYSRTKYVCACVGRDGTDRR